MKFANSLTLAQKGLILVSVPLVFELAFVGVLAFLLHEAAQEIKREAHSRKIIEITNSTIEKILVIASGGGMFRMSNGRSSLKSYEETLELIPRELDRLSVELSDNPQKAEFAHQISAIWKEASKEAKELQAAFADQQDLVVAAKVTKVQRLVFALTSRLHEIVKNEQPLQEKSIAAQEALRRQVYYVLAIAVMLNIAIAVALSTFFSRSSARRLNTLLDNSIRLGADKPLNPMLTGTDEIASVDKVFHFVAEELARAKEAERLMLEQAIANEKRIRKIIDSMPVGLLVLKQDGSIQTVNPTSEKIFDYPAEALEKLKISELLTDIGSQSVSQYVSNLFEKATGHIVERIARKRDGNEVPIELTITEYLAEENLSLAIVIDVTERHEIKRLQREFVSIVSHELRTPMSSVMLFLSLAREGIYGELPPQVLAKLEKVDQNMQRLMRLVNDLLNVEKIQSGSIDIELSEHQLSKLIERSVDDVRELASSKDVTIESKLIPLSIQADADRLIQVLVNLLSNAIKYSPKGGTIEVLVDKNEDFCKISIQDMGPGIPPEQLKAVFERFHQVRASDSKEKGGTGLGLSIAKAIVEVHGGEIGVESTVGKGSKFWFKLPMDRTARDGDVAARDAEDDNAVVDG